MKKKLLTAVLLSAAAITLVVATVFTTVALLTASSAVSNVFTIGDVKIEMLETSVDINGVPLDPVAKTDRNSYHLKPGNSYTKDPTIYIRSTLGNDEMFLFIKSSNQIRSIESGNVAGEENPAPTMRQQMEANGWVEFIQSGNGVEIVWVYGSRNPVTGVITPRPVSITSTQMDAAGNVLPGAVAGEFKLCQNFTVAKGADISTYAAAKVTFNAFAIQNSGLGVTENDQHQLISAAWDALKSTYSYEGGITDPKNPYSSTADPYAPVPQN